MAPKQRLWATLPIYHDGDPIAQHEEVTGRFDGALLDHLLETGQVSAKEPHRRAGKATSTVRASTRRAR